MIGLWRHLVLPLQEQRFLAESWARRSLYSSVSQWAEGRRQRGVQGERHTEKMYKIKSTCTDFDHVSIKFNWSIHYIPVVNQVFLLAGS